MLTVGKADLHAGGKQLQWNLLKKNAYENIHHKVLAILLGLSVQIGRGPF